MDRSPVTHSSLARGVTASNDQSLTLVERRHIRSGTGRQIDEALRHIELKSSVAVGFVPPIGKIGVAASSLSGPALMRQLKDWKTTFIQQAFPTRLYTEIVYSTQRFRQAYREVVRTEGGNPHAIARRLDESMGHVGAVVPFHAASRQLTRLQRPPTPKEIHTCLRSAHLFHCERQIQRYARRLQATPTAAQHRWLAVVPEGGASPSGS